MSTSIPAPSPARQRPRAERVREGERDEREGAGLEEQSRVRGGGVGERAGDVERSRAPRRPSAERRGPPTSGSVPWSIPGDERGGEHAEPR